MMKKNIIYTLLLAFLSLACTKPVTEKEQTQDTQPQVKQLTLSNVNSEGAFLFTGTNETILTWTESSKNKKDNILKFVFYNKQSDSFSNPISVIPSKGLQLHAESMAKVAITKNGTLYAFFRIKDPKSRSMYGGILYYSISTDKGINWSTKTRVVTDTSSTSQSFYDVALLGTGQLGLVWLDNRKLHQNLDGQTLYFAKTNENNGFQKEIALEGSVCQCCRTEINVDQNHNIHIGFRNLIEPQEMGFPDFLKQSKTEIRDLYYISSTDNGTTFSSAIPISNDHWQVNGCPHTGPSLATVKNTTGAVWFTGANNETGVYFATQKENNFNQRTLISKEGKHPQMIAMNDTFYIVFEEYYELENKGYTRIMLQERNATNLLKTTEISIPKTNNHHAVVKPIGNDNILISWINDDVRNSVIQYRVY